MSDPLDELIDSHLAAAKAPADPLDELIDAHLSNAPPGAPAKFSGPGDIGAAGTLGAHTARHLSFGMGDKVVAGIQALEDKWHDKTGKVTLGDAYRRDLAFNDKALDASDAAHPVARWAGNALGVAGSVAAPAGALRLLRGAPAVAAAPAALRQLAGQGAKTGAALGAVSGFGGSRSDTATGALEDTAAGAGEGAVLGAVGPYAARGVGRAAGYLGNKAQDAAGWLKVNSLHPTPTLGEAMEDIPGGRVGVGRELLQRGIGGLTKHGTAEQLARAARTAGGDIERVARAYDTGGGAPLDLTGAIDDSLLHAAELNKDPLTREAGNKLAGAAGEYRQTYGTPTSAVEALALKRRIGSHAYKQTISTEPVAGDFGAGLSKLERGVDSSMDSALGPEFEQANLSSRRLYKAKDAAERVAARSHSNHVLGLIPMALGAGGYAAHGAEGGAAAALGATLLGKYGSQAGARTLYGLGGGLGAAGEGLQRVGAPAAAAALTPAQERLAALAAALRRRPSNSLPPMLATQDDTQ